MKTSELRDLVRARLGPQGREWAVFDEVRSETGWSAGVATRSCDMLAMNLWRSKGLEVHGFELKISRGDWLRELKQPDKAEAIAKYVDHWWLVAAPGVARIEELPPGWGLLVPETTDDCGEPRTALRAIVKAPKREAAPLDRLFVAALLRKAVTESPPHPSPHQLTEPEKDHVG